MDINKHVHGHDCSSCSSSVTNPSVYQSIDEIDFERSIWQAAIDNDVEKIKKFAKGQNFNPNATDKYGYNALHYAARNGSLDAAKCLVELGANVNAQTGSLLATALHRAVTGRKPEMVKFLLEVGADTKIVDSDGLTPLDRALKEADENIVKIFQLLRGIKT